MAKPTKVTVVKLNVEEIDPFKNHALYTYSEEQIEKLGDTIESEGLITPITVQKMYDGRYQILSGHNRLAAVKGKGHKKIDAIVKEGLSDFEAEMIMLQSNLNQQSFNDWGFKRQLQTVKRFGELIRENSRQGQRAVPNIDTDTQPEGDGTLKEDETSVRIAQKLGEDTGAALDEAKFDEDVLKTTRDKLIVPLNISSTKFARLYCIAQLPEDEVDALGDAVERKQIAFYTAHKISRIRSEERARVIAYLQEKDSNKVTFKASKELYEKSSNSETALSSEEINKTLGIKAEDDNSNLATEVRDGNNDVAPEARDGNNAIATEADVPPENSI